MDAEQKPLNKSIFKAYDIRGIYPTDINEKTAALIGTACVKLFNPGEVLVAYDARHGSPELARVLEESIRKSALELDKNISVRGIGLSTTPMFYFLVNHFKTAGGCMVTASHNPKEYNGIKIVREGAEMVAGTDILSIVESL